MAAPLRRLLLLAALPATSALTLRASGEPGDLEAKTSPAAPPTGDSEAEAEAEAPGSDLPGGGGDEEAAPGVGPRQRRPRGRAGRPRWPLRCRDGEASGFVKKQVAVHVTSFGGVGTTSFMHELGRIRPPLSMNDPIDRDCVKHVPYQRAVSRETPQKIVYLHGDPLRAILSLDGRGWFLKQARKLRVDPLPGHGRYPETLQEYLDTKGDFLQLDQHFDSFFTQCEVPVAFLRISEKKDHDKELAAFLNTTVANIRRVLRPWRREKMTVQLGPAPGQESARSNNSSTHRLHSWFDMDVSDVQGLEVPERRQIVESLRQKLHLIIRKLNALPGFTVITPGTNCTRREHHSQRDAAQHPAALQPKADVQEDAQEDVQADARAQAEADAL